MLDLSLPQLAGIAKLSVSTILDAERRTTRPISGLAMSSIRKALEEVGIEFIGDDGTGEGVRLKAGGRMEACDIHRETKRTAARWMKAEKRVSVL